MSHALSQYMQAAFIYGHVTDAEYEALPVTHYMTILGGVRYIGTDVAVEALESKLIPQTVEDAPAQE